MFKVYLVADYWAVIVINNNVNKCFGSTGQGIFSPITSTGYVLCYESMTHTVNTWNLISGFSKSIVGTIYLLIEQQNS